MSKTEHHFRAFIAGEELALRDGGTLGVLGTTAKAAAQLVAKQPVAHPGDTITLMGGKPWRVTKWVVTPERDVIKKP